MDLNGLFQSPAKHVAAFAEMQVHLYRHDKSLQDYFHPLQLDMLTSRREQSDGQRSSGTLVTWAIQGADRISQLGSREKIKTDVLFCPIPHVNRKTENRFLVRTLLGLAQTDAKILCLLPSSASCRGELDTQLKAAGRSGQVVFLDPMSSSNPIEARLRKRVAQMRGRSAFEETTRILEPHGLNPGVEIKGGFDYVAFMVEAWERLSPRIEFETVIARCHWNSLCSPVCRTAQQRGKQAVTFQQGVIGHTLDVPVTASKYVAFGEPSAAFLAQANRRFFQAVEMLEPPVEYIHGGCLFDTITLLPDQYDQQTLLMVDVPMAQDDFYGTESQCSALLQLAEKLLAANIPLRQLIIRPHPYWNDLDFAACQRLAREYPTRCQLSHPAWSLEDDLRRSSAAIGVFSGVLTVAAACGLPTIFLETENGYKTGDLACFSPRQTLLPDAAFCQIARILSDRHAYAEAREESLKNAHEYYTDGANLDLSAAFFERLLRNEPATNPVKEAVK